ncbi:MAG: hypothetical protein Ta2B_21270 [Termitinemataceae bacterium]|nr:MAG: hypothetical protein Ta2B_21270 [Termitinemataceae bacterium]
MHVWQQLGDNVDIILDGGACKVGVESTVLDLTKAVPQILRHGGTPKTQIEALIGEVLASSDHSSLQETYHASGKNNPQQHITAPGQTKSHYAPRTKLFLFAEDKFLDMPCKKSFVYLFFDEASRKSWVNNKASVCGKDGCNIEDRTYALCKEGCTTEAAAVLFETLHKIDALSFKAIYVQAAPCGGLGDAINDRLKRASYGHL